MLWEKEFTVHTARSVCQALVNAWKDDTLRVFVLRATEPMPSVREQYESYFSHLGTPGALAEDVRAGGRDNQRTGDIWMEVRFDPSFPNAYRHSANAQPLHTDGSYIPGYPNATLMACVANAGEGGETTFLCLSELISVLENENPELLHRLRTTTVPHARSGDRRVSRILEGVGREARIYWNYYCVDKEADADARALAEDFHAFLATSVGVARQTLAVKLRPGDGVLWKDDELLHGRNSFVATRMSERFLWKCAFNVGIFS